MLHCSFQLFLRCRFRKPRNQLRVPKYHVHVYPMISSTSRIESRIVPICEVTKSPSGYASADPVCRLLSGGACKCLYVERVPFCVSKIGALGIHRDLVESSLVICVAEKIWLFVVWNDELGYWILRGSRWYLRHGQIVRSVNVSRSHQKSSHDPQSAEKQAAFVPRCYREVPESSQLQRGWQKHSVSSYTEARRPMICIPTKKKDCTNA